MTNKYKEQLINDSIWNNFSNDKRGELLPKIKCGLFKTFDVNEKLKDIFKNLDISFQNNKEAIKIINYLKNRTCFENESNKMNNFHLSSNGINKILLKDDPKDEMYKLEVMDKEEIFMNKVFFSRDTFSVVNIKKELIGPIKFLMILLCEYFYTFFIEERGNKGIIQKYKKILNAITKLPKNTWLSKTEVDTRYDINNEINDALEGLEVLALIQGNRLLTFPQTFPLMNQFTTFTSLIDFYKGVEKIGVINELTNYIYKLGDETDGLMGGFPLKKWSDEDYNTLIEYKEKKYVLKYIYLRTESNSFPWSLTTILTANWGSEHFIENNLPIPNIIILRISKLDNLILLYEKEDEVSKLSLEDKNIYSTLLEWAIDFLENKVDNIYDLSITDCFFCFNQKEYNDETNMGWKILLRKICLQMISELPDHQTKLSLIYYGLFKRKINFKKYFKLLKDFDSSKLNDVYYEMHKDKIVTDEDLNKWEISFGIDN